MSRARLYLPLIIIAAACGDAAPTALETPQDLGPSFSDHEVVVGDYPTGTRLDGTAVLAECSARCTIVIGTTQLLAWAIPGGAEAVAGIQSPAQIAFVIGGTDTIPGPPAPGPVRRALRNAGTGAFSQLLAVAGFGTDTIPGPPPAPFVYRIGDNALMVFSVEDLARKGALRYTEGETDFAVIWTTGSGRSAVSWEAAGRLPPTDTIPGPPAPTATKRGK